MSATPFRCVVTHTPPCPETGEPGNREETLAEKRDMETLAAAIEFGQNETHGVATAKWCVFADLSPTKACNAIKASRNKRLGVYVHMDAMDADGNRADTEMGLVELKAPQVVAVIEALFRKREDATVGFTCTEHVMFVG